MYQKLGKYLLPVAILFTACKKDDVKRQNPDDNPASGFYVLSEGNVNNTKLGFYSFTNNSFVGDYFIQQNPTLTAGLGDLGNDMIIYGSKLYIVLNNSNLVRVLRANDAKFIDDISFDVAGVKKQPRYAAAANGKVFVTAWDGTVNVIDTTALNITKSIPVGLNPEGIVVSGNQLFVANSGGLNYPVYDSTISVINISTLAETKKIKVGINPVGIDADDAGNIYVGCIGNYGTVGPKLVKVNATSGDIVKSADTAVGVFRYYDNHLYVTGGYLGVAAVRKLNTTDFSATSTNFVTDGTAVQFPYGINVNPQNGDVYVTDAKDFIVSGAVHGFDKTGKKILSFSITPGINPNKVVFKK